MPGADVAVIFEIKCDRFGKIANNPKGSANATPNPASPVVNGQAPPLKEPTSNEPRIGPVHEKDTIAKVKDMKKMPPIFVIPAFPSALVAMLLGSLISKKPKKEKAKNKKIIKKAILSQAFVERVLKISGFTFPAT